MYRWTALIAAIVLAGFVALGCTGGGANPLAPDTGDEMSLSNPQTVSSSNRTLWGYWDLRFDFENQTVEAVPNRSTLFNANVVDFLNPNPLALGFEIINTPVGPGYVDVDLNVSITHPLPGLNGS